MGTKAYSSQAQAQTAYTNKFASEPSTRPSYIPSTISHGGANYTVVYHGGCYGYYDPTGLWIALAATEMLNNSQPMLVTTQPVTVIQHPHSAAFYIIIAVIALVVIGGILYVLVEMA